MLFTVTIKVTLKTGVLDPAATQVQKTLINIGFPCISKVVMGKMIAITVDVDDKNEARDQAHRMCSTILANPVMEKYEIVSIRKG